MSFPTGLEVGNHYLYNPLFILYGDVANTTSMLRNIKGCGFIRLPSSVAAEFFFSDKLFLKIKLKHQSF